MPNNMNDLANKMVQPIVIDWQKKRQQPIEGTQRDEWQSANGKIMGLPSSLFNDARLVALKMQRDENRDASNYVADELTKDLIPKYWEAVVNLAKHFSLMPNEAKERLLSLDQATVLPGRGSNQGKGAPPAGGTMPAGGGAPPGTGAAPAAAPGPGAMAFNLNKIKKTAGDGMYVQRDHGDSRHFRLRDTLVGRIMSGTIAFFGPDGAERKLVFKKPAKGKVQISRGSQTAQEAIRTEESMPAAIAKELATFLKAQGRKDAVQAAHLIVERAAGLGRIETLPCVIAAHAGPDNRNLDEACLLAFAIACGCDGVLEPEDVTSLRSRLGQVMGPNIENVVKAMEADGIECSVKKFPMPICTPEGRETRLTSEDVDKDIGGHPRVLDLAETGVSADISSLILTAMNSGTEPHVRVVALDRASALLCRFPEFFSARIGDISAQDIRAASDGLANKSAIKAKALRLARLMELLTSTDDSKFMEEFHEDRAGKLLVAELIGSRNRFTIIDAAPEMCLHDGFRKKVSEKFFCKLDPTSPRALEVMAKVAGWWSTGEWSPRAKHPFISALMRALLVGKDRNLAIACSKIKCPELAAMAGLKLAILGNEGALEMIDLEGCPKRAQAVAHALLCMRLPDMYHCLPMEIALMLGRDAANQSMSSKNVDWDGMAVSDAPISDPLGQAKRLEQSKDYDQLAKLLTEVSKKIRKSKDPELTHAAKYIMEVLDRAGMSGLLLDVFKPSWMGRGGRGG